MTTELELWTLFTHVEVIKCDPGRDFYVAWSHVAEAPTWAGTRAEASAEGCEPDRLDRADETGSSYYLFSPDNPRPVPGLRWGKPGLVAEQLGYLPRGKLAAYVTAYCEDRLGAAYGMLERFEDVSREDHLARIKLAIHHHDRQLRPRRHRHCRTCHPEQAPKQLVVDRREYHRRQLARQRRKR